MWLDCHLSSISWDSKIWNYKTFDTIKHTPVLAVAYALNIFSTQLEKQPLPGSRHNSQPLPNKVLFFLSQSDHHPVYYELLTVTVRSLLPQHPCILLYHVQSDPCSRQCPCTFHNTYSQILAQTASLHPFIPCTVNSLLPEGPCNFQ